MSQNQTDPNSAFQVYWGLMDGQGQMQYTNATKDQQSMMFQAWYTSYVTYLQQNQQQQQQPVQQIQPEQQQYHPSQQEQQTQQQIAFSANMSTTSVDFVPGGGNSFTPNSKAFEDDLGSMYTNNVTKASKKVEKKAAAVSNEPTAEDLATSHKGKPSAFFALDKTTGAPNGEQMGFIYEHYPEYGSEPDYTGIFTWFFQEAKNAEAIANAYSQKPSQYRSNQYDGYGDETSSSDEGIGAKKSKKGGKKDSKNDRRRVEANNQIEVVNKLKQKKLKTGKEGDIIVQKKKVVAVNYVKVKESAEIVTVDESRQPTSLVFIGHVDVGKSTICGNLMLLTGQVDQRVIEGYKLEAKKQGRDSWWLAYVMDNSKEEMAKGKTVEMGRAFFDTPTKEFTVFDAPGHKNYVPNMIKGASLADYAALVISARKGEFEAGFERDGQTREHVHLAKCLGVQQLVVVVNKMDEASVKWNPDRYNDIKAAVQPFLIQTGFDPACIHWVPISGITGENMVERLPKETCSWYDGPSLTELLEKLPLAKRDAKAPLRLPILDKMNDQGSRYLFGKIEQGTVSLGDKCMIAPDFNATQIAVIYNSKSQEVPYARPGENVKLKLLHLENDGSVNPGDVLCHQDEVVPSAEIIEADVEILELLTYKPIFCRGYTAILHMHTLAEECSVKEILSAQEKDLQSEEIVTKEKPKFIRSFAKARIRISFKKPICIEKCDVLPALGQFTLRDEGKTIAMGRVQRYKPVNAAAIAKQRADALAKQMEGADLGQKKEMKE